MADLSSGQHGPQAQDASALDRIDRALARIEAAATARAAHSAALARRHDTLRTRMAEAIAALDAVIETGDANDAARP